MALLMASLTIMSGCSNQQKAKTKFPTRVKTEVVSLGLNETGQNYVGIVEEREATAVSFTGMGVVRRVLVSEGQAVGRGQLLAEMDDTQARNTLAASEAAVMQAEDALQRMTILHDAPIKAEYILESIGQLSVQSLFNMLSRTGQSLEKELGNIISQNSIFGDERHRLFAVPFLEVRIEGLQFGVERIGINLRNTCG